MCGLTALIDPPGETAGRVAATVPGARRHAPLATLLPRDPSPRLCRNVLKLRQSRVRNCSSFLPITVPLIMIDPSPSSDAWRLDKAFKDPP